MNGEWNMKSLIRKGYEILDERAIFRYHKDKQKLELDNPYWKMCMWVWDDPRLPINVPLCQEIIEATNEPHTGKNFFATPCHQLITKTHKKFGLLIKYFSIGISSLFLKRII